MVIWDSTLQQGYIYVTAAQSSQYIQKQLPGVIWPISSAAQILWRWWLCLRPGLTGEEKEERAKAKENLEMDQGEDGEDGGNYKTQNQFHTHLKKQEVKTFFNRS